MKKLIIKAATTNNETTVDLIKAFETWFYKYAIPYATKLYGYSFAGSTISNIQVEYTNARYTYAYVTFNVDLRDSEADSYSFDSDFSAYITLDNNFSDVTSYKQALQYLIDTGTDHITQVFTPSMSKGSQKSYVEWFEDDYNRTYEMIKYSPFKDILEDIEVELYTRSGQPINIPTFEQLKEGIQIRCVCTVNKRISSNIPNTFYNMRGQKNFIVDAYTFGFTVLFTEKQDVNIYLRNRIWKALQYLFIEGDYEELAENLENLIDYTFSTKRSNSFFNALQGYPYRVYIDTKGNINFEIMQDDIHTYRGERIIIKLGDIDSYVENGPEAIQLNDLPKRIRESFNRKHK